jgi:hypothetical protein
MYEKVTYITTTGRRRRTGAYHVDHISEKGMPAIVDLKTDLGIFADALMHTPLRVLCVVCHKLETSEQSHRKHNKGEE